MAGRPARPSYAGGRPGLCWTKVLATRPEAPFTLTQLPVSRCSGSGSSILAHGRSGSKLCHHKKINYFFTFPSFFTNVDLYHLKKMSKFTLCTTQVLQKYLSILQRKLEIICPNVPVIVSVFGSRRAICGSGNEALPVFVWFSARLARRDIYM
jgi:hypothetical protein